MQAKILRSLSRCPKDTAVLAVFNFLFSLVCFKNLLNFFSYTKIESWYLLGLATLGFAVSWGIFYVQRWAFHAFHYFVILVVVSAMGNLYFSPSLSAYFLFVACISYAAITSAVLHRNYYSACFQSNARIPVPKGLFAFLSANPAEKPQAIELVNLSPTGCLLKSPVPLKIGSQYQIEIQWQDYQLNATAKVLRQCAKEQAYGLMFTGIDRRKFTCAANAVEQLFQRLQSPSA